MTRTEDRDQMVKTKHFARFYFPGALVTEYSEVEIESPDAEIAIPERCYAYCFRSEKEVEPCGDTFCRKSELSGMHYFGVEMTIDDIESMHARRKQKQMLLLNMTKHGWTRFVQTHNGSCYLLFDSDVVVRSKP